MGERPQNDFASQRQRYAATYPLDTEQANAPTYRTDNSGVKYR